MAYSDVLGVLAVQVLMPSTEEMRAPLRVRPASPSAADREAADLAIDLEVRDVTRPLPARFLRAPPLAEVARSARGELRPRQAKLRLPVDRSLPLPPPDWPEPDRPLPTPEVFVDVIDATK